MFLTCSTRGTRRAGFVQYIYICICIYIYIHMYIYIYRDIQKIYVYIHTNYI